MQMDFLFSMLWMFPTLTENFMALKSSFLAKPLSAFVILAGWWSPGFRYLTKHHLKQSLSQYFEY